MAITPVKTLVAQAKEQIETLLQEDAEAQVAAGTAQFIDIRDIRELKREGRIPGACLLYTSPSPRDATLSRMPSSA